MLYEQSSCEPYDGKVPEYACCLCNSNTVCHDCYSLDGGCQDETFMLLLTNRHECPGRHLANRPYDSAVDLTRPTGTGTATGTATATSARTSVHASTECLQASRYRTNCQSRTTGGRDIALGTTTCNIQCAHRLCSRQSVLGFAVFGGARSQ
jgi:hypothetical protein